MFSSIKETMRLLRNPGKTSLALRWRLQLYLLSFIGIIFSIIIAFIFIFDIFSPHKTAKSQFELQLARQEFRLETYFNTMAAQGIHFSRQISREIEKTLAEKNAVFEDMSDNQDLIAAVESNTYALLHDSLRIADCSGSFIILDTTVNTKLPNAKQSRAGTYLKLANVNTPKPVSPTVLWTRGVHEIGHSNDHIFHNKWQLEFDVSRIAYYDLVMEKASKDLVECYYYSPAFVLHGTWEQIMILCVPIVGKNGQVFGLCGFEINSIYFRLLHAETGSSHQQLFGLLAQKDGDTIRLETGMEFGSQNGYYAGLCKGVLTARQHGGLTSYSLNGSDGPGNRSFIGLDKEISLSPLTDPRTDAPWVVVSMIPMEVYHSKVRTNYIKLISFCVTFFVVALILAYYISRRYNLPILQGIDAIKEGSMQKTNITEIDDLMEFLATNDTTQGDVDMSAFYEFKKNAKKLSRAEAAVFNLYMEGYSANKIAEMLYVSINTIKSHNKNIYRKLHVSSRKELMVYAQMMKASD